MKNIELPERMKSYEKVPQIKLTRRMPYIIRIDGKAFHTFTKGMKKPWDERLVNFMLDTAKFLCEQIQGVKLAYWQSDEISLLLTDYDKLETDAWFDKNVQKITSVSASYATGIFNERKNVYFNETKYNQQMAYFDSKVFVVPKEDVCNYFIWRQRDAERNSILSLGNTYFSPKQMHKKNNKEVQEMLWQEYNINWNDCVTWKKRGACIIKKNDTNETRNYWSKDLDIPIFSQNRDYIEQYI